MVYILLCDCVKVLTGCEASVAGQKMIVVNLFHRDHDQTKMACAFSFLFLLLFMLFTQDKLGEFLDIIMALHFEGAFSLSLCFAIKI